MASFFVGSKIIIFITVCVYVLTGNTLSASSMFMAVSLYGAVRLTITLFFPYAIEKVSESLISIRRVQVSVKDIIVYYWFPSVGLKNFSSQDFLLLDEVAPHHLGLPVAEKECMVEIQDLLCYWDKVRIIDNMILNSIHILFTLRALPLHKGVNEITSNPVTLTYIYILQTKLDLRV